MTTVTEVKPFEIATHNGFITATNSATGEHRTFRIATQKADAKFAPGMRIVGLLVGQDNENDYKGFGFVIDGAVVLWSKNRDSKAFQWYANFLTNPERYPNIKVNFDGRCRKCNRHLTDPISVSLGIGPKCRGE